MEVFFKWCSMATESVTLKNFKWQEDSESRALEGYVPLSSETCIGFINEKISVQARPGKEPRSASTLKSQNSRRSRKDRAN